MEPILLDQQALSTSVGEVSGFAVVLAVVAFCAREIAAYIVVRLWRWIIAPLYHRLPGVSHRKKWERQIVDRILQMDQERKTDRQLLTSVIEDRGRLHSEVLRLRRLLLRHGISDQPSDGSCISPAADEPSRP